MRRPGFFQVLEVWIFYLKRFVMGFRFACKLKGIILISDPRLMTTAFFFVRAKLLEPTGSQTMETRLKYRSFRL